MTVKPSAAQQVPTTTLQLGDRTIVVEATPLAKSPKTRLGVVVGQPRANRLELKQLIAEPLRSLLAFLVSVVALPPLIGLVILLLATFDIVLGFVASITLLSSLVIASMYLFGRHPVDFSRQRVWKAFPGAWLFPITQARVLAIQLIPGRRDEDLRADRPSIQINLLLDQETQPRVGFITFRDAQWTRQAGRRLADYLGVPLVDQIP